MCTLCMLALHLVVVDHRQVYSVAARDRTELTDLDRGCPGIEMIGIQIRVGGGVGRKTEAGEMDIGMIAVSRPGHSQGFWVVEEEHGRSVVRIPRSDFHTG